jgi:hypothetical protein
MLFQCLFIPLQNVDPYIQCHPHNLRLVVLEPLSLRWLRKHPRAVYCLPRLYGALREEPNLVGCAYGCRSRVGSG